ncbi:MAG: formylglycine-generating enzyme family protein, partial [Pirellulales bacterium]|nr:formylglycine-generating enzyme family protein [Pirellulales bacterium]
IRQRLGGEVAAADVVRFQLARLSLGDEVAFSDLRSDADRNRIIFSCHHFGCPAQRITQRLLSGTENAPEIYSLLLCLGQYPKRELGPSVRTSVETWLLDHLGHPDAGVHNAIRWLAAKWELNERVETILLSDAQFRQITPRRNWYYNSLDTCMIVFQPGAAEGFPANHRFAISATEVTCGEMSKAVPGYVYNPRISPNSQCPAVEVSFPHAVQFCHWLTELEGQSLPAPGRYTIVESQEDYTIDLRKPGYRPPIEAEWEYACRAALGSGWFVGDHEFLAKFGWFTNSFQSAPVGTLAPSPNGLFDVFGNAEEWMSTPFDRKWDGNLIIQLNKQSRGTLKGGSFRTQPPSIVSTTTRNPFLVSLGRNLGSGLRLARTITPEPDHPSRGDTDAQEQEKEAKK